MLFRSQNQASGVDYPEGSDGGMLSLLGDYRGTLLNLILVASVFFVSVRPLLKSLRNVTAGAPVGNRELQDDTGDYKRLPGGQQMSQMDRVRQISEDNPEKTEQLLRGWANE